MNFVQNQVEPDTSDVRLPAIDLNAVVADFRRFSRFFLAIFAITLLAIIVPGVVQPPKYTAQSTVMIDPRTLNAAPAEDVLSGLPADTTTVDTEVEVLKSNALADRVIKSLKLDEDPEFNPSLKRGGLMSFGKSKADTPLQQQSLHEAVVARVIKRVAIKRSGLTRIITIDFTASTPEKAAKVANEWARLYLSQQLETKFQATQEANNWLSGRLGDLKSQVEQAETAVQQYKIAHGLMSTTDNNTIAQSEISTLDQQLASVKVEQAESEARLAVAKRQLAGGSTGEDVGEALNSDVIKSLRAQRAQVSQHVADLETRYGPLHPDIIKAKRQLDDIDVQIKAEVKRLISNLEAQAQIQRQRTASLQSSVGAARGNLAGTNEAMVKLNELQRNADAVSSLYQSYLDRFKQTTSQAGLDKTDARIVSTATLPSRASSPNIPVVLMVGFAGALMIGVTAVLIRRGLDTGLTTGPEVESVLKQPYLAGIASLASTLEKGQSASPLRYVVERPLSVFAEGFRSLRVSLIYSRLGEEVKVIALTSSLPGEGKTTTSVCLARAMALAGQSVVIVDCDLRRRSLNDVFGKPVEVGLLEVMAGTARLEDVLIDDDITPVKFLPLARSSYTPKDVFGSPIMDRLLETLRQRFDLVILDTAPVLPVVDTRVLARKADVVVMLVRWRHTSRKAVKSSLEMLEDVGARIGGVVLTQINVKDQAKYGYGDSGYYYKQYKKYYAA